MKNDPKNEKYYKKNQETDQVIDGLEKTKQASKRQSEYTQQNERKPQQQYGQVDGFEYDEKDANY